MHQSISMSPLVVGIAIAVLSGCTSASSSDPMLVSRAAASTVAAIQDVEASRETRVLEVTRILEVTRVVEVTRIVSSTRIIEVTRLPTDTRKEDPASILNQVTPVVTDSLAQNRTPTPGSRLLVGTALLDLPVGEPDTVGVLSSEIRGGELCAILRNNTEEDVCSVDASGEAYDPAGKLVAVISRAEFNPNQMRPNEIAIGCIGFGSPDIDLPSDTRFDIKWKFRQGEKCPSMERDLEITKHSLIESRIVGYLRNPYSGNVAGPIHVLVHCFDQNSREIGRFDSFVKGFSLSKALGPGESAPYQVDLFEAMLSMPCTSYLISASGWSLEK